MTDVMTMLKRMMNFELYSAPIWRPPISDRHLSVTLRNSGTSRNCGSCVGSQPSTSRCCQRYTSPVFVRKQKFAIPTHPCDEVIDDGRLEDVAERDPVEEAQHGLERDLDERRLVGLFEHLDAERKDFGEFLALRKDTE